ncbi:MAG: hypothetical protein LBF41_08525 [Deltaproteobacteria bacterium]|jgi:hypothetical protein|nr:hypothetical protein [Deltaproteobacteria bacterium]
MRSSAPRVRFFSALATAVLLTVMSGGTGLAFDPETEGYVRWEFKPPPRHKNGAASVSLNLVSSDGKPLSEASWYYKATPLASFRMVDDSAGTAIVRGSFGDGDNTLTIDSGVYLFVELMGTAVLDGKRHYAQTHGLLFGESLAVEPPEPGGGPEPDWPSFAFSGSGEIYWPQTGHTFVLSPKGDRGIGEFTAMTPTGKALGEYVDTDGGRGFVPATDKELNAMGATASKPVFFVAGIPDGGSVSYTIYVHRSRYGGEKLNLGFVVFSSTFVGTSFVLILFFRRRRVLRHVAQES